MFRKKVEMKLEINMFVRIAAEYKHNKSFIILFTENCLENDADN